MPQLMTASLRERWGERYQIDRHPRTGVWRAVRRDDTARVFEHAEPEELWQMLRADDLQAAARS